MAQGRGIGSVAIGCNSSDWLRFPDCRPPFWRAVAQCGEAYGVKVLAPLVYMSKLDVIEYAAKLNVPIGLTWSCYAPADGEPCGRCLACKTRKEALECQPA